MEKTGYYDNLLTLIQTDWLNRKRILQTEASASYTKGLGITEKAYATISNVRDIELITRAEALTVLREYELYGKDDPSTRSSLNAAISDFSVIANALPTVQDAAKYKIASTTHHSKKKINGIPIDGFHEAINSHITRLGNRIRTIGISAAEKDILRQRKTNMKVAKDLYIQLQKKALEPID